MSWMEKTDKKILEQFKEDHKTMVEHQREQMKKYLWHNGLLHDPHPSGKSILDIMTFEVIIPKENVIS